MSKHGAYVNRIHSQGLILLCRKLDVLENGPLALPDNQYMLLKMVFLL